MSTADFQVVVCGGGIAGSEALLRLHRLAPGRLQTTLIEPQDYLTYRPLAVREPFAMPGARRYPLDRIAFDAEARWEKDQLARVDRDRRRVHTEAGHELAYDALLLAVGARESAPYEHAQVFTDRNADETFHGIVQDIEMGYTRSIAFLLPDGPAWPLPLYELALLTAERAYSMNMEPRLYVATPEQQPLQAFGGSAGERIAELLKAAGIELHTGVSVRVPSAGRVSLGEIELDVDRIVTLPRLVGPALSGVPAGDDSFVPIDEHCLVPDTDGRVFAAGDITTFPIKHGGVGAQQADTAAAAIAHLAGAGDPPPPLRPQIRGMLLTGRRPLYFAAYEVDGGGWKSEIYEEPPWPADEKVVAEELGPYLSTLDSAATTR